MLDTELYIRIDVSDFFMRGSPVTLQAKVASFLEGDECADVMDASLG